MNEPNCPSCGSSNSVYQDEIETNRNAFWCQFCKICFDNDPDEGGDYSNNPTLRIERQEQTQKNRKRRDTQSRLHRPRRKNRR